MDLQKSKFELDGNFVDGTDLLQWPSPSERSATPEVNHKVKIYKPLNVSNNVYSEHISRHVFEILFD